ncbi:unnamed protein product [Brassica napus]|uniref:(rape) hypothetical protein n=1 Tax=Brassica napus TaxID=3708 RepID=A0A816MZ53_BRANA|nr:unnamed protein product [Brassica napus]
MEGNNSLCWSSKKLPSMGLQSSGTNWSLVMGLKPLLIVLHDGTALWGIIGSVSNATLCVVLKRILNQARPATTSRTDPGMPSSHAQSISYISLFAILSVLEWLGTSKVSMFLSCLIIASDTVKGFSEASHKQSSGSWCNRGFCFLHLLVHNVELASP